MPKYYSPEDKSLIVKKFKQSGLPKEKFCKSHKIANSSLYRWLNESNHQSINLPQKKVVTHSKQKEGSFVPVKINKLNSPSDNNKNFVVKLPDNIIIEFPCGFSTDYFCRLMKALIK